MSRRILIFAFLTLLGTTLSYAEDLSGTWTYERSNLRGRVYLGAVKLWQVDTHRPIDTYKAEDELQDAYIGTCIDQKGDATVYDGDEVDIRFTYWKQCSTPDDTYVANDPRNPSSAYFTDYFHCIVANSSMRCWNMDQNANCPSMGYTFKLTKYDGPAPVVIPKASKLFHQQSKVINGIEDKSDGTCPPKNSSDSVP